MDEFSKELLNLDLDDMGGRIQKSWKIRDLLNSFRDYSYQNDLKKYELWYHASDILFFMTDLFRGEGIEEPEELKKLREKVEAQQVKISDRMFDDGFRDVNGNIKFPKLDPFYLNGKRYKIHSEDGIKILKGIYGHGDTQEAERLFDDVMTNWKRTLNDTSGDD